MKTLIFFIAICFFSVQLSAGNSDSKEHPEKYCAKMSGGKLIIMHQGIELAAEATLANGTRIKADGTVIKTDGSIVKLKSGECMDKDGKIMEEKTKGKAKKEKS